MGSGTTAKGNIQNFVISYEYFDLNPNSTINKAKDY